MTELMTKLVKEHRNTDLEELTRRCTELNNLFECEYEFLGEGWSRRTYDIGNGKVAKVPYSYCEDSDYTLTAFYCNIEENEFSQNGHPDGFPVAKTFGIEDWFGIPVLIMEKVSTIVEARRAHKNYIPYSNFWPWDEEPDWCDDLVDGKQVGINSEGNLVVYDYASNVDPETGKLSSAIA